jgi:hypothetical protein
MARERIAAAALILCALIPIGGCGDAGDALDDSSPVIAAVEAPRDTPAASFEGAVVEEKDGCLVIGDQVVVWGEGTTWDADSSEVVLPSGQRLAVGDQVTGGGGGEIPDPRSYFGDAVADRVGKCGGDVRVVYVAA